MYGWFLSRKAVPWAHCRLKSNLYASAYRAHTNHSVLTHVVPIETSDTKVSSLREKSLHGRGCQFGTLGFSHILLEGCPVHRIKGSVFAQEGRSCLFSRSLATIKGKSDRRKRDLARREFQLLRRKTKLLKATLSLEEKLLWRLKRANRKKAVLLQRLKKYELEEEPEPVHDPELITSEQHHALKKIGYKNRNYVPVGRRGVFGGVVQNMHMHWKFHETVQVDCHIYKHEDVKAVARKLALLSGGIVIDIHQATNIIMYRGRNYKQPKKEMIPPNTLTKRKALFKSKYIQALESLNELIQNIESELQTIRWKQKQNTEQGAESHNKVQLPEIADYQTEELLAKLSDISSNSEDEDGDDGIFSWDSDSLDEDELSDVNESITRKGEIHEKKHTRSEFSREGDSIAHSRKKNRPTVRELILAEQQLFKERGSGKKFENVNLDDGLQTDNDDDHISHASTKGDHPLKASDTKKQKSGRIKNRKISSFVEDLTSDSDAFEKLDSDFDG